MSEGSYYDKDAADYAVGFIECLCHTKGTWARKPFELIDWQEQIIRDIFGTLKPNGYRQFNTAYIEIPKKQGKSELAAAVALLLTCGDGEERAEVYGCAADRQQASIVFNVAADMVRMCPALAKRVKILDSQKRLIYLPTGSIYQVLSADVGNKHGFNTHGVVFDELHTQPNRKLYDVMTKGSGDARMQPLYFLITTAGNDTKSICYEIHQKAKDIIEGRKFDPTFYPVIYGADEEDDWTDPKTWKKANPSLGITVGLDKVKAACESAKQNPAEENSFRQLRLNQWVKQAVRWMPMEKWDKCAFTASEDGLEGRVCYGGLDLSSTTDITAFVLVFPPEDEDDKYMVLPYFWIPEDNLDLRVRRDHVPYDVWERQGFLQTTEGNVVHYGYIEKFIERLGERYNIREIAFDRWGAVQMVQNLEGMGFTVIPFGQGFKDMSPPTKELMKLVLEEKVAHGGHPVFRWMPMHLWDKCEFAANEDDLEGRVCYGGLDLSSTTDITAFVLVFPPEDNDDKYVILPYFWIPEDNLELRVRRDHVPYDVWERQGFLQTTEGNVVHYGYIERFIERLGERFNIREIAFDRWGAVQMVQNLEGMGFTVVPFGQGFKDMSPPTKELMKLVLEEKIAHGGHPVLRWMMDNIFIRTDPAGNIKPDKEKSTEKIDGAVATIMALDRAIRCGNDTSASVYDDRGIFFI